jgi:anti-sigma factor RsiW
MDAQKARALFELALDGELDAATRAEFDAALRADSALRAEYEELEALRQATRALAEQPVRVDLLSGVQHKLRARSGGKFYRDRFAEQRGRQGALTWMLAAAAALLLAVSLWFFVQNF